MTVLALTATVVCATAADQVTDGAGLFSFAPPEGWSVSRLHTSTESTVRADLFKPEAHLTILARPLDRGVDWDQWQARFKQALANIITDAQYGPYNICGVQGLAAVGQSKSNQAITADRVAFKSGGSVFIITLVYPTKHWQRFRADLDGVLSSFKCLPRQ